MCYNECVCFTHSPVRGVSTVVVVVRGVSVPRLPTATSVTLTTVSVLVHQVSLAVGVTSVREVTMVTRSGDVRVSHVQSVIFLVPTFIVGVSL